MSKYYFCIFVTLDNCRKVSEKQLIFKCFQTPQISSCQNKTLHTDGFILVRFRKVIFKWVKVPNFWKGQVEK